MFRDVTMRYEAVVMLCMQMEANMIRIQAFRMHKIQGVCTLIHASLTVATQVYGQTTILSILILKAESLEADSCQLLQSPLN
ncbi:hypothetical protein BVRB_5g115260 isoform A [Beta vulgaris subsp. vulgaris]|nr:hypothetical protein BVRB_5g115260 isoform A [Beta vulgaris subsp. vulgaris]